MVDDHDALLADGPELCPTSGRLVRHCRCPICSPGRPDEVEEEPYYDDDMQQAEEAYERWWPGP